MTVRTIFAVALAAMSLTGCAGTTIPAGATETALCEVWGASLPTRSRQDTSATQDAVQRAYAQFAAACPAFEEMIP